MNRWVLYVVVGGALAGLSACEKSPSPPPAPPEQSAAAEPVAADYQPPSDEVMATYNQDLDPYGHWVNIDTWGRCWTPNEAPPDWQPYTVGHWVDTDQGWSWEADGDEANWGMIVYHYGCWYQDPHAGWVWVPGTTWAPAWVAWRTGDGYCAWAPLPPQCAFQHDITPALVDRYVPPDRYVCCQESDMTQPNLDQHLVRDKPAIVNQTTNITRINVSGNRAVNPGVPVADVEHATGHSVPRQTLAQASSRDDAMKLKASGKPILYAPPAVQKAAQRQSGPPAPAAEHHALPQNANPPASPAAQHQESDHHATDDHPQAQSPARPAAPPPDESRQPDHAAPSDASHAPAAPADNGHQAPHDQAPHDQPSHDAAPHDQSPSHAAPPPAADNQHASDAPGDSDKSNK